MSSRAVYYFAAAAVILTHNMIFPVKGQSTIQGCENGVSSNSIVEEIQQLTVAIFGELKKQVQGIRDLTESLQEMKSQLETVQAGSIKNETQNSWKIEIAYDIDFGEVPILQSTVNDWIVIMHRSDGSLNFNRTWSDYRNGFGAIGRGEFWLGNKKIHLLTNRFVYTLRIEVQVNETGRWFYADYATFFLDSEDNKYALQLSGFNGTAGDSLSVTSRQSTGMLHTGSKFSTWDDDNDRSSGNCAQYYHAGWWFDSCYYSCLTCQYNGGSFHWRRPDGLQSSGQLRSARMMIKSI